MLEIARQKGFDELILHNLEEYPYPDTLSRKSISEISNNGEDGLFDILVCVGVMDFIKDPKVFLEYISGFMKHGTRLLIFLFLYRFHFFFISFVFFAFLICFIPLFLHFLSITPSYLTQS